MVLFSRISILAALVLVLAVATGKDAVALNSLGQASCATSGYSTTYSGSCSGDAASASSTVTASESVALGTAQTVGLISGRIGALGSSKNGSSVSYNNGKGVFSYNLSLDEDGKAAGGSEQQWGIWINGAWTRNLYSRNTTSYAGNTTNGMVGFDYRISDEVLVGLATGYENTDNKTSFNSGNEDITGWTGAAYALFDIDKTFSLDVTGGYSRLSYDMDRKDGLLGTVINGETDADRLFGAVNLNGAWTDQQWQFGGRFGLLYAQEERDGFTETGEGATTVAKQTTTIGRASIGGDIGYAFDDVTPYVKANYNYDYKDGGSSDNNFLDYGLGLRFDMGNGVSGGVEGTGIAFKDNLKSYGANASLRVQF